MGDSLQCRPGPFGYDSPPVSGSCPTEPLICTAPTSFGPSAYYSPLTGFLGLPQPPPFTAVPQAAPVVETRCETDGLKIVKILPAEIILLTYGFRKRLPEVVNAICNEAECYLWYHEINRSPLRVCHFLAQLAHESLMFTSLYENLSYTVENIVKTFGVSHSANVTIEQAKELAGKPEALAERVYGLGNPKKAAEFGHLVAGEGWRYRGRGLIHLTGKANYAFYGDLPEIKLDLVKDPDLAANPLTAVKLAVAFWKQRGLSALADADMTDQISRRVNGGDVGLKERGTLVAKAKDIWLKKAPS